MKCCERDHPCGNSIVNTVRHRLPFFVPACPLAASLNYICYSVRKAMCVLVLMSRRKRPSEVQYPAVAFRCKVFCALTVVSLALPVWVVQVLVEKC